MSTDAEAGTEPGRREPRLDQHAHIPVLGIRVAFESNDAEVIRIVDEAFGAWRVLDNAPRLLAEVRMRYRITVEEGEAASGDHVPIIYWQPDPMRVILRAGATVGVADAARREALIYTNRAMIADRQHFRYGVLEALALAVLTRLDRVPLHAACITRGDTALLLAGPSGCGKSTLAYAAARAGYKVLSEDYVNVQMEPRLRVWGMPGYLHLPPEAAEHFPELAEIRPGLRANGKLKIAINLSEMGAVPTLPVAQRAGLCILERTDEAASLETLEARHLLDALAQRLEPGFDVFAEKAAECYRLLGAHGGWKLRVGKDPQQALDCIESMFGVLSGIK
jgi:hypothetical protein